jgi:hypothetical protein
VHYATAGMCDRGAALPASVLLMMYIPLEDYISTTRQSLLNFCEIAACALLGLNADEFVRACKFYRYDGIGSTSMSIEDMDRVYLLSWEMFLNPLPETV